MAVFTGGGDPGDWGLSIESHAYVASYYDDVDLTIAWGLDDDPNRPLSFPWQFRFADSSVTRFYADVFWRGALVDRQVQLSVDGGRVNLPQGRAIHQRTGDDPLDLGEWLRDEVSPWAFHFARVTDELEGRDTYESLFDLAGFAVLSDL